MVNASERESCFEVESQCLSERIMHYHLISCWNASRGIMGVRAILDPDDLVRNIGIRAMCKLLCNLCWDLRLQNQNGPHDIKSW